MYIFLLSTNFAEIFRGSIWLVDIGGSRGRCEQQNKASARCTVKQEIRSFIGNLFLLFVSFLLQMLSKVTNIKMTWGKL